MTTSYLTRKFISTTKPNHQMIQLQKKRTLQELAEIKKSLQRINKNINIKNCRLCLRPAECYIFSSKAGVNFADFIKQFLNIEVGREDGKPQYICQVCQTTLCKIVELKQTAEVSQWRLQQEIGLMPETNCEDYAECHKGNEKIRIHKVQENQEKEKNIREVKNKANRVSRAQGPFICETCGHKSKKRQHLSAHMLVHSTEFAYACSSCPYRARAPAALAMHVRTHSAARPFRCPHAPCAAAFRSASNLASHRRTHLPPLFHCSFCSRGFKFKQPLQQHIATQHRNAKPFCCSPCGISFAIRKQLLKHERKIHNRPCLRAGTTPSYIATQEQLQKASQQS